MLLLLFSLAPLRTAFASSTSNDLIFVIIAMTVSSASTGWPDQPIEIRDVARTSRWLFTSADPLEDACAGLAVSHCLTVLPGCLA